MPVYERYADYSNAAGERARRVFVSIGRRPSLPARVLFFVIALAVFGLLLILVVPLMIVGALGMALLWFYSWVRSVLTRSRRPGGAFDRRQNVRVIERRD